MAASTLFRLGDFPSSLCDPHDRLESLPALEHRFDLPSLDEYAAGSERLLEGLENLRLGGRVPTPSRKGKEKEILTSIAGDAVLLAQNETSMSEMWERVVDEGEAGPSSRPTFQVSRTLARPHHILIVGFTHLGCHRQACPRSIQTHVGTTTSL